MADLKSVDNAARASWIAFLLQIGFRMVNRDDAHDPGAVINAGITVAFSVICFLAGIGAGAYALVHARSVGAKGAVVPALIGLALCSFGLLVTVVMVAVLRR